MKKNPLTNLLPVTFLLLCFSCSHHVLVTPEPPPISRGGNSSFIAKMEEEKEKLKGQNVDPSLDGVVAFFNALQHPNEAVSGKTIAEIVDQENPNFKVANKDLYQTFERVKTIFNKDGTIYLTTTDNKKLELGKITIESGARFRSSYSKDQMVLNELVGIYAGMFNIELNKISMDTPNGDLKVEYGNNKAKKVNLKKDILK